MGAFPLCTRHTRWTAFSRRTCFCKALAVPRKMNGFYPSIREALDDLAPVIANRLANDVQLIQIIELLHERLDIPIGTLEIYLRGATIAPKSKPSRR